MEHVTAVTEQRQNNYDPRNILTMESVYGEGFMSPGGPAEVIRIVEDVQLDKGRILDLGCGTGGAGIVLAKRFESSRVVGLDIEPSVLERARELVHASGLAERIDLELTEPGRFPFPDESFDIVYANSTTCHIDKLTAFFDEVHRVLKPGGLFLGADWYVGEQRESFEIWDKLLRSRGLNFYFAEHHEFSRAAEQSGFESTVYHDRSEAMLALAREGLTQVQGKLREPLRATMGDTGYELFIDWARERARVLEEGGMSHCHFRAKKT